MALERCSCEFASLYAVLPRTVRTCLADSPWLADSPRGVMDRSADHLDRTVFSARRSFCMADRPRLSSKQSAPSLADSPGQRGGQSGLYAVSCQACSIPLLLL
jgi:hypothetical protein